MTRRILEVGAWLLASLVGLGLAAYAVAEAVNWRDQEPSATALRFAAAYRDRPALADEDNAFTALLQFNAGEDLLQRYQTLIVNAGWKESVPTTLAEPLPEYAPAIQGQRLLLSKAQTLAQAGDHAAVRKLLRDDLRFWRTVLASSDTLISKMIATTALNQHFEAGNLALKELEPAHIALAMPAEWDEPLTESERSMQRCLIGEWIFGSGVTRQMSSTRFFQPQDSINELADYYSQVAALLDAPLLNYQTVLDQTRTARERRERDAWRSASLYNLANRFLIAQGSTDFASYAARVNDVEGVRRAALAAARFHERNIPANDVAAALETAPFRNPYDDRPFAWDVNTSQIVFTGLQPDPRGQHRIQY